MHAITTSFRGALESIFYFYLNSLDCSRREHLAKKSSLEEILKKMQVVSPVLTTREAIIQNHIIAIKNYNQPPGEDLVHSVPHLLTVEASLPGGYYEGILGASVVLETYHLWEEEYRSKIAEHCGKPREKRHGLVQ